MRRMFYQQGDPQNLVLWVDCVVSLASHGPNFPAGMITVSICVMNLVEPSLPNRPAIFGFVLGRVCLE